MFKIIINLLATGAGKRRWQLELGAYLLKKGCGFEIGQIIKEKRLHDKTWRVKVVTGLFYDFKENKINHTAENRIIKSK